MAHLIEENDIERLAFLSGVHSLDLWREHLAKAKILTSKLLSGTVQEAWDACLPFWLEQGRVNDLSHGVRITGYFPSFACLLGNAFREKFADQYLFLIEILEREPLKSVEYLCAFDLLEEIYLVMKKQERKVPLDLFKRIFRINRPVPPVVRAELGMKADGNETIGEIYIRISQQNNGGPTLLK